MDSLTLRVQAEQIAASVPPGRIGPPVLESDPDTVALLIASLSEGNYREAACADAGISKHSLYRALKRAEDGEVAAIALRDAIERAEGAAEAGIVRSWRKAIDSGPQYWAAAATFLERKAPDRWGKRQDDTSTPKVVVQIGTGSGDVQIHVSGADAATPNIIDTQSAPIDVTPTLPATYAESGKVTEGALSDTATGRIKVAAAGKTAKKPGGRRGQRRGIRAGDPRR